MTNLRDLRREYLTHGLREEDLLSDPLAQLEAWVNLAVENEVTDATSMVVATAALDGEPSCRVVLLKGIEAGRLLFFTRYSTRKSIDLAENPKICALFHYREFNRQVRVQGTTERVDRRASEAYWNTRPRASRIAARVACGRPTVPDRSTLEAWFAAENAQFPGEDIPLPDDWGGFAITPYEFEFWQGRENRLHDRVVYTKDERGGFEQSRLSP
jgi:pyridoxamine 5'-phosphate oxidase